MSGPRAYEILTSSLHTPNSRDDNLIYENMSLLVCWLCVEAGLREKLSWRS